MGQITKLQAFSAEIPVNKDMGFDNNALTCIGDETYKPGIAKMRIFMSTTF